MEYEQEELAKIEAEIESGRADVISQRNELDDKIIQMTKEFEMSDEEQEELFTEKDSIMERTSHLDKEMEANKQRIFKEESEKNRAFSKKKKKVRRKQKKKDTEKQKKDTQDANTSSVDTKGWIRPTSGRISSSYGYRRQSCNRRKQIQTCWNIHCRRGGYCCITCWDSDIGRVF